MVTAARWALGLVLLAAAACTPERVVPAPSTTTVTSTVPTSAPPVPAARYVATLPPGRPAPAGERDGRCPYIRTGLQQDPAGTAGGRTVADIEGNRIYRTTRLRTLKPVGCRFYFWAPPFDATADIRPRTYPSGREAYAAMVVTARAGKDASTVKNFAGRLTGIAYRTRFNRADGARSWAFVFAKGSVLVVVRTERTDTSRNAVYLAAAIAPRF